MKYETRQQLIDAAEEAAYKAVPMIMNERDQEEWDRAYIEFLVNVYFGKG